MFVLGILQIPSGCSHVYIARIAPPWLQTWRRAAVNSYETSEHHKKWPTCRATGFSYRWIRNLGPVAKNSYRPYVTPKALYFFYKIHYLAVCFSHGKYRISVGYFPISRIYITGLILDNSFPDEETEMCTSTDELKSLKVLVLFRIKQRLTHINLGSNSIDSLRNDKFYEKEKNKHNKVHKVTENPAKPKPFIHNTNRCTFDTSTNIFHIAPRCFGVIYVIFSDF